MTDDIFFEGEKEGLLKAVSEVVRNHPCTVSNLITAIYQLGRLSSNGIPPYMVAGTLEKLLDEKRVNADD